ncbi:hypothetical protein [Oceanobacillus kimchii]|uniref:Uncharacterized protein n=1 Tax=Oceanobacillus kimchii TaxID=746691 RepID=A0ABQ5TJC4_9BACI|nr:hypothetical protein [Oceanobacillus kimchii]GLO66257.1 hypothetical protein MACH08_20410 [Oceanobacillus kimchii]
MKLYLIDQANKHKEELNKSLDSFLEADAQPKLFLTNFFNPSDSSSYNPILKVVDRKEYSYQDIQNYIAEKVIVYLKTLDEDVDISLTYPSSYPSNFKVSYRGEHIISFSIQRHHYSSSLRFNKVDSWKKRINSNNEIIADRLDELQKYKRYKKNLLSVFSKKEYETLSVLEYIFIIAKDTLLLLKAGKAKIKENIQVAIDKHNNSINKLEEENAEYEGYIEEYEKILPQLKAKNKLWQNIMKDMGYKELRSS